MYAGHGVYETEVAPPDRADWPEKTAATWDKELGEWIFTPDHRGETWWDDDGTEVVISELGDPDALGMSATRVIVLPTINDIRIHGQHRKRARVGAIDDQSYADIIAAGVREAIRLLKVRVENNGWTAQQAARAAELDAVEAALDLIDQSTTALEVTLPEDYRHDRHWPS